MSNSREEEPVNFRVIMSDASSKEIPLSTSSTKLSELKQMLAQNEYFGARAPVGLQRLFHLGRELKSGGRSLCNLGLGRFNNRIIHLCVRPESEKSSINRSERETTAGSRKRNRETPSQQLPDRRPRQRSNPSETIDIDNDRIEPPTRTNTLSSGATRPVVSTNNPSNTLGSNSAIAIDLVDSSDDDDEVEVIEVLY